MSKNLTWKLLALLIVLAVVATACGGAAEPTKAPEPTKAEAEAPEPTEAAEEPEEPEPSGEVQDFVTWYQFDQENDDPAHDEAVGNAYLRETIPQFNEAFADKWNWMNTPKAWDKMEAELAAAVMAGGDVPDLMHGSIMNAVAWNATAPSRTLPNGPRRSRGTATWTPTPLRLAPLTASSTACLSPSSPTSPLCGRITFPMVFPRRRRSLRPMPSG